MNEGEPQKAAEPLQQSATDDTVVPLHVEEISVTKKESETGRVRVSTVTREREELIDELLKRERVAIERVPIGKPVTEMPRMREEGETIIVPIVDEVLVVERSLVLREEIRIRRVHETERHQERVTLHKQEAVVTRLPVGSETTEASSISADRSKESHGGKR